MHSTFLSPPLSSSRRREGEEADLHALNPLQCPRPCGMWRRRKASGLMWIYMGREIGLHRMSRIVGGRFLARGWLSLAPREGGLLL
jgi:hypothetical protein